MENQTCQAQLDAVNVFYEKGQEATMDLMVRAAQESDGGRGFFMPD